MKAKFYIWLFEHWLLKQVCILVRNTAGPCTTIARWRQVGQYLPIAIFGCLHFLDINTDRDFLLCPFMNILWGSSASLSVCLLVANSKTWPGLACLASLTWPGLVLPGLAQSWPGLIFGLKIGLAPKFGLASKLTWSKIWPLAIFLVSNLFLYFFYRFDGFLFIYFQWTINTPLCGLSVL